MLRLSVLLRAVIPGALFAVLALSPALAQDAPPIQPGDERFDTSRIESDETVYTITIIQGANRQDIGTMTATTTIDEEAGTITGIRAMEMMGQKLADTTRAAWPSFESQYHHSNNMQRTLRFSVQDGTLSGTNTPNGGTASAFEMSVDGPVFDSSWMGTLAAMLPLEEGYTATIPAYTYESGGLTEYVVTVLGQEEVQFGPDSKATLWAVEAANEGGEPPVRLYFDPATYEMRQMRMNPQAGLEVLITEQGLAEGSGK